MKPLRAGGLTFEWGARTYVMGILNITPDSFSGDGLLASPLSDPDWERSQENALGQARRFLDAGCHILDIGGESTRPGSEPVDVEEENRRVIPILRALAAEFPSALLSIDTCKSAVAREAFKAGAHILNDVWGLRADPELATVAAQYKVPVILMHNRSNPASVEVRGRLGKAYGGADYTDLLEDVKRELMDIVTLAREAGIPDEHIILDPGIGFGKTVSQNLELINRLGEIRSLGFPILLGPSRKSFIGYILDVPPEQRVEGTAAAVAIGIVRGADILRVHDVEFMTRVVKMADALVRPKN